MPRLPGIAAATEIVRGSPPLPHVMFVTMLRSFEGSTQVEPNCTR